MVVLKHENIAKKRQPFDGGIKHFGQHKATTQITVAIGELKKKKNHRNLKTNKSEMKQRQEQK